jgi:hypothetical protein
VYQYDSLVAVVQVVHRFEESLVAVPPFLAIRMAHLVNLSSFQNYYSPLNFTINSNLKVTYETVVAPAAKPFLCYYTCIMPPFLLNSRQIEESRHKWRQTLTHQIKCPNFGAIVRAIIDAILPQQLKNHEKSSRITNSY